MVLIELLVDMIRVAIREQGLGLLALRHFDVHRAVGEVDGPCDVIESQMECVQLFTRLAVAQLNSAFLSFTLDLHLVQCLVELDNADCHFVCQSPHTEQGKDNQK